MTDTITPPTSSDDLVDELRSWLEENWDPDITVGVWLGLDQKKPIGRNQTGSEAALPIWIDVMKAWIGDRKDPPKFEPPGNIVFMLVDKAGAASEGAPGSISEAFIAGTQPGSLKDKQ